MATHEPARIKSRRVIIFLSFSIYPRLVLSGGLHNFFEKSLSKPSAAGIEDDSQKPAL